MSRGTVIFPWSWRNGCNAAKILPVLVVLALPGCAREKSRVELIRERGAIHGGDPDSWANVKKTLPLLSEYKWHSQTKHGYARGSEPVKFVENIRRYNAMLTHLTYVESKPEPASQPAPVKTGAGMTKGGWNAPSPVTPGLTRHPVEYCAARRATPQ